MKCKCGTNLKKNHKIRCTNCKMLTCYLCITDYKKRICNKCKPDKEDIPDGAYWALKNELEG